MTTTTIVPQRKHAVKLIDLISHGLVAGLGDQEPGKMCVEAAVCCALGLEHGDAPPCVGYAVRAFKIRLNDCEWSSNQARGEGMQKLAVAQLGSNELDQKKFGELMFLRSTQKLLPMVFRKVAADPGIKNEQSESYIEHANNCEAVQTFEEAERVTRSASASAYAYAYAYASAYASAWFRKNFGDDLLIATADVGLAVLIEMKSPGCKWLNLCKVAEQAMRTKPNAFT